MLLLLACPAEDGLQTVISIAARPLEHPLADRLERNHQSPRNVPVPKMLVHIVLGSVPGRIQNRNRFGFVRLFERCRTPGPRYVATPTAGSDHEERFTEMAHACQDCKLTMRVTRCSPSVVLVLCGWSITTIAQQPETRFGGAYSGLGDRRLAQFVLYSVPDDVAASFDCASQMMLADPATADARILSGDSCHESLVRTRVHADQHSERAGRCVRVCCARGAALCSSHRRSSMGQASG